MRGDSGRPHPSAWQEWGPSIYKLNGGRTEVGQDMQVPSVFVTHYQLEFLNVCMENTYIVFCMFCILLITMLFNLHHKSEGRSYYKINSY